MRKFVKQSETQYNYPKTDKINMADVFLFLFYPLYIVFLNIQTILPFHL